MSAYASVEEYLFGREMTASGEATELEADLMLASRWWDRRLRRRAGFNEDADVVARAFYVHRGPSGRGSETLFIDDIASVEDLVVRVDDEELDEDDYELWPLNAALGEEPRPYDRIVKPSGWPLDTRIEVDARWGWPGGVPNAIKQMTIEWAAIWRGESSRATGTINEMDEVASLSPYHLAQLKRLEELYKKPREPYVAAPRSS